jgi:hypothetical protein
VRSSCVSSALCAARPRARLLGELAEQLEPAADRDGQARLERPCSAAGQRRLERDRCLRICTRYLHMPDGAQTCTATRNPRTGLRGLRERGVCKEERRGWAQWIPDDPALWNVDAFTEFCAARRELLVAALNQLLGLTKAPTQEEPLDADESPSPEIGAWAEDRAERLGEMPASAVLIPLRVGRTPSGALLRARRGDDSRPPARPPPEADNAPRYAQ